MQNQASCGCNPSPTLVETKLFLAAYKSPKHIRNVGCWFSKVPNEVSLAQITFHLAIKVGITLKRNVRQANILDGGRPTSSGISCLLSANKDNVPFKANPPKFTIQITRDFCVNPSSCFFSIEHLSLRI